MTVTPVPPSTPVTLSGLMAVLLAVPVLWPFSQGPIVTATGELLACMTYGAVVWMLGVWAWRHAPQNVAGLTAEPPRPSLLPAVLMGALTLAGLGSAAIAFLQVLAAPVLHGDLALWVVPSHLPGRAVGHLRQPNHLATVLLWGAVGWVALQDHSRMRLPAAACGLWALIAAVVLSGSRTGLLGLGLLVLWAMCDRRLARSSRILLLSTPVMAATAWAAMQFWSEQTASTFGAAAHLAGASSGDVSSSRFAIWRNTWTLIAQQPWLGVGWGHFNIAWTLTPMTERPTALFDHAHNLPLHLMAELGVPLGLGLSLAMLGLWIRAARRSWADAQAEDALWRRASVVMLGIVGLHSLLEYPLWYAYFFWPTVLLMIVALGGHRPWPRAARWQALGALVTGGLSLTLALWAHLDYQNIRAIYEPAPKAGPLTQRMQRGQANTWFADHAHYAWATTIKPVPRQDWTPAHEAAFIRAPHVLLDARLMMAWADALAARDRADDRDRARHLAARLREFNPPSARKWLDRCETHDEQDDSPRRRSFVCEAPERAFHWRELWP